MEEGLKHEPMTIGSLNAMIAHDNRLVGRRETRVLKLNVDKTTNEQSYGLWHIGFVASAKW